MAREIFVLIFLMTVGNLAHCQEWENLFFIKMEVLLEKQEAALVKQEAALSQLKGMQEKQEQVEGKLQEMQEKLQYIEINLQGTATDSQDSPQRIHQETKGCLRREDLEHFKNITSAEQQKLEFSLRQEISGIISLLETGGIDECSDGSHNCTDYEACADKLFKYQCSCLPGFAWDGSRCEDVDECAQGKDECSPLATCRNSVGSYSCSCNPPSEGDGKTCICPPGFAQKDSNCEDIDECTQGKDECSAQATCRNSAGSYSCSCNPPFEGDGQTCEFPCKSQAKYLEGLGCVKLVPEWKTFEEMKVTCHQAGGHLLQNFSAERLQEVARVFGYYRPWLGVQEGNGLENGLPLQEELWTEGSLGSDPSGRRGLCGIFVREDSSSTYKVGEHDCSSQAWGYCQFINPQK
ncbi:multiple epidermal growth factor-like domains protein 6 isoform X2 [Macrobrachium nipponense]|uniref:multiple epidermal growth factor-like domains protein 6 isoform X2 n=1 Tax=Macrobrachium nipponense TaxID=159736 RepID=UPI0030C83771